MKAFSIRAGSLTLAALALLTACSGSGRTTFVPTSNRKPTNTTVQTEKEGGTMPKPTAPFTGDDLLTLDTEKSSGEISDLLYGACMEDVNHELYGGIWSQMIFGESFEEAAIPVGQTGFTPAGGVWSVREDATGDFLYVDNTPNGPKLVIADSECTKGSIEADVWLDGECAGLIVKTANAAEGADNFDGYEISLLNNGLRLGRHRHNYTHISDTPCTAPQKSWIRLRVEFDESSLTAYVNGEKIASYTDSAPLRKGAMGFRSWNASARWKNVRITADGVEREISLDGLKNADSVSGMWRAETAGDADVSLSVIDRGVYNGRQAQRMEIRSGEGRLSISNMGLNRGGMGFVAGKDYNGYLYAKSETPLSVWVALESGDGSRRYAETSFTVQGNYQKYPFVLTPDGGDKGGRFVIEIRQSGTLDVDYVFLEPGDWGLYKGLHVRRDVGEMLEKQGITVLRFGGCMANAADYKWKKMTGNPENRGVYNGWWYGTSSYGFGIVEFMDLCEALGVTCIPDFSSYESPSDMGDFIRFACGDDPSDPWVKLRREMGREEPYHLHYIQIGNEDKIDGAFAGRFNAIADEIWAQKPDLTLIVGDFEYKEVIKNPNRFTGNTSGITSLAGHKLILDNAVKQGGRVWFDIHFWSESGADPLRFFEPALSFYAALKKISPEADTGLCVLELNANRHTFERALCNAFAINFSRKHSDVIHIMCSANALQVQGHNDNGWDQGLIFMDNENVWYQPPAYIDRMLLDGHLPRLLETGTEDSEKFAACAAVSADGGTVSVTLINRTGKKRTVGIEIPAFGSEAVQMRATTYADRLSAVNTAANPEATKPGDPTVTENALADGRVEITVEGYSLTVITFRRAQA